MVRRKRSGTPKKRHIAAKACDIDKDPYFHKSEWSSASDYLKGKQNNVANPRCIHGLGELSSAALNKKGALGIYTSAPKLYQGLGEDPALRLRRVRGGDLPAAFERIGAGCGMSDGGVADAGAAEEEEEQLQPVGLVNLGATCYLNVILQVLFMNEEFRQLVYQVGQRGDLALGGETRSVGAAGSSSSSNGINSSNGSNGSNGSYGSSSNSAGQKESEKNNLLPGLFRLFHDLEQGLRSSTNPVSLVDMMGLDHLVQKDAKEFTDYFFSALESLFEQSFGPRADGGNRLHDVFGGEETHTMHCLKCGKDSVTRATFKSLMLPIQYHHQKASGELTIKHRKSIEEMVEAYLGMEDIGGYECQDCAASGRGKQDALRSTDLTSSRLPRYLMIHLGRFDYDWKKMEKKKICSKVSIPLALEMGSILNRRRNARRNHINVCSGGGLGGLVEGEKGGRGKNKSMNRKKGKGEGKGKGKGNEDKEKGEREGEEEDEKDDEEEGEDDDMYDCMGICYHHGNSASCGHYTAQIRSRHGTWYVFGCRSLCVCIHACV